MQKGGILRPRLLSFPMRFSDRTRREGTIVARALHHQIAGYAVTDACGCAKLHREAGNCVGPGGEAEAEDVRIPQWTGRCAWPARPQG